MINKNFIDQSLSLIIYFYFKVTNAVYIFCFLLLVFDLYFNSVYYFNLVTLRFFSCPKIKRLVAPVTVTRGTMYTSAQ